MARVGLISAVVGFVDAWIEAGLVSALPRWTQVCNHCGSSASLWKICDGSFVNKCLREIQRTASVPTAEVGLRAVPTTVYFVSMHNG